MGDNMKKSELRKIIKEELKTVLKERISDDVYTDLWNGAFRYWEDAIEKYNIEIPEVRKESLSNVIKHNIRNMMSFLNGESYMTENTGGTAGSLIQGE